jgi:hypothetical protein
LRRHGFTVAFLLALAAVPAARGGEVRPATVEGTSLVVLAGDGRRVSGQALVGAVVVAGDLTARQEVFRIDGVRVDPDDSEVTLHDLSVRDGATGEWKPYCVPDERGVAGGLFLSGSWDARGTHLRDDQFSATCTSGAIGKCVRHGYKPWKTAPDGRPMWDYHQACTRLIRADYCGDGRSHTREGVRIEILSRLDPKEEPGSGLEFEAGWMPDGASCVARPRLAIWSLEAIAAECPARLQQGAGCTLAGELGRGGVLLANKSPPDLR